MAASDWQLIALFFKQLFDGGYRYLDQCGQFMIIAEEKFRFIPTEAAAPTGCKMNIPEDGIELGLDTAQFTLRQEGKALKIADFSALSVDVSRLVGEVIRPVRIASNGSALHLFRPFQSEEKALSASLSMWRSFEADVSKVVGMSPLSKALEFTFASGSYRLVIKLSPASLRSRRVSLEVPHFAESQAKRERIKRRNSARDRLQLEAGYGLLCEIDLVENLPPLDGIGKQFHELQRILESTLTLLS